MWLTCPECRDESVFEQPPCSEGHGADCPEWFCVTCGYAIFDGGLEISLMGEVSPDPAGESGGRAARRRAA